MILSASLTATRAGTMYAMPKREPQVADLLGASRNDDASIVITRVTWGKRKACTQEQLEKYLNTLAETGRVKSSARAAGLDYRTIYFLRKDNALFALAEKEAREAGSEALENEAIEQATVGIEKGVWHQGVLVGTERVIPANPLLQFLLKAQNPARFMERSEVIGRDGGKVPERITSDDDRAKIIAKLDQRAAARVIEHKPEADNDLLG